MKKFLFLYTELADYFLVCAETLAQSQAEVLVVHWPVNKEAPFQLKSRKGVKLIQKDSIPLDQLKKQINDFSPDAVYCSGWIDKDYLNIVKTYKSSVPCVIGIDNQWKGSLKQWIACLGFLLTLKRFFTHCWIPGEPQYHYARFLGFRYDRILKGFYSADVKRFNELGDLCMDVKKNSFPKRFIFVGRYYSFKGVRELWKAFSELQKNHTSEWELWCLGTGDISGPELPGLKHFGFVQPDEMGKFIRETGVFILPSKFEPWGVVVHEFAAAGFPLLLSDKVGAASQFLKNGKNGSIFTVSSHEDLEYAMLNISKKSDLELLKMGEESRKLAATITPEKWAQTLLSLQPLTPNA